jgi:sigma-E factor negative regulatory protein RseB
MRSAPFFRNLGALALLHCAPVVLAATDVLAATEAPGSARVSAELQSQVQDVQSLIVKMSRVSHSLNYQGSFTYEHKDSPTLQGFRVAHWVVDGVEHERLQYLSGPEREIVRQGQELDCLPPGDQLLQGHLTHIGSKLANLDELYQFQSHYVERVAGRVASVLQVAPRDAYRYGYILSVDQETGLVLKSLLVDANGRILERYQFLDLTLNPEIEMLEALPPARRQRVANTDIAPCNQTHTGNPTGWQLDWVPNGFAFVGQQKIDETRDMLMYTDGLTTFSVFIEPTSIVPPEGVGQRGATLMYMAKVLRDQQLHRVSVVGEIPIVTAEQIAAGIKPSPHP